MPSLAGLIVAGVAAAAPALAQSPCPGIHVKILDIRNSTWTVACALFESPDGFPIAGFAYDGRSLELTIRLHY